MFKLDNDFLVGLGLGSLPVDEKNKLLQAIYERLEMNVGMRLAERMTDAQLDEFESFIDRNDEAGALRWLETNFPNYKDVVAEELEKLKQEVQAAAPQILATAQGAPVQPQQTPSDLPPQSPPQNQQFNPPTPQQPVPNFGQNPQPQIYPEPTASPQPSVAPQPQPQPEPQPQFAPPQPQPNQPDFNQPNFPSQQPPAGQPPAGFPPAA